MLLIGGGIVDYGYIRLDPEASPSQLAARRAAQQGLALSQNTVVPSDGPNARSNPQHTSPSSSKDGSAAGASTTAKSRIANQFGISTGNELPGLSPSELTHRLDTMKSLGIGWIRLDIDWDDIQHDGPNDWNWTAMDNVIASAQARGLKLLPLVTYTPRWARIGSCADSPRCAPQDPAQFAAFAKTAAARYAPRGVHYWEIWNEPNDNGSWLPHPDTGAYTTLLKLTYPAIKQVDPSATVITGGLAPSGTDEGIPQLQFLQQLYDHGARPYFDGVGYHPYSYPVPASYRASWSAWSMMSLTQPSFRSIMTAAGDSNKKIWATEYGAPTGGPGAIATTSNYNLDGSPDHVTESLQAVMAIDMVKTASASPWLAVTFWYAYQDPPPTTGTIEDYFGLIRSNGQPKPAYTSLKSALTGQ